MVEVSKVSSKGQVTIPLELRKYMKLTEGSKVAFVLDDDGRVVLANSSMLALKEAQAAFAGEAERLGLRDESDVAAFLKK